MAVQLINRLSRFLNESRWTDVEFYFDGNKENKICAHKLIIASVSPVFEAMCFGLLKEMSPIEIQDIQKDCFQKMICFIYTNKIQLEEKDVCQIFYAAEKYMIFPLKIKCNTFIINHLSSQTVLFYLDNVRHLLSKDCIQRATGIIQQNTFEVLNLDYFRTVSLNTLKIILQLKTINVSEKELFNFVMQWAKQQCNEHEMIPSPNNLRRILDDELMKLINFPAMSLDELVTCIEDYPEILSDMEFRQIIKDKVHKINTSGFNQFSRCYIKCT